MKLTKKDLLDYAKKELDIEGIPQNEIKEVIDNIMRSLADQACEYLKEDLEEIKK